MPNVQHKRGTRAALDALAAAGSLKAGQLYLLTDEERIAAALSGSTYQTYARQADAGDPWTRFTLASDFVNATASFATITDGLATMSWTPPAGKAFTIEAELLFQTATPSNLPRIGVSIGAGQAHGAVEISHPGSLVTSNPTYLKGTFLTSAAVVQMAGGSMPAAATPFLARVLVKGRAGSSPGAIALQMAAESAAANTCSIRAGSEMRARAA